MKKVKLDSLKFSFSPAIEGQNIGLTCIPFYRVLLISQSVIYFLWLLAGVEVIPFVCLS